MMDFNFMSFGAFGFVYMILAWVIVIGGVVLFVKWVAEQGKGEAKEKSALDILKERYAKGEIGEQEFEERKKGLNGEFLVNLMERNLMRLCITTITKKKIPG